MVNLFYCSQPFFLKCCWKQNPGTLSVLYFSKSLWKSAHLIYDDLFVQVWIKYFFCQLKRNLEIAWMQRRKIKLLIATKCHVSRKKQEQKKHEVGWYCCAPCETADDSRHCIEHCFANIISYLYCCAGGIVYWCYIVHFL